MTYQGLLQTINNVAMEAAECSFDAHGHGVAPEMAWDFITGVMEDTGDARRDLLPKGMPLQFKHDYRRHCRHIRDGNPFYAHNSGSARE